MFLELAVTLGLMGIILTCLSISLISFQRFNDYQLTRQKCIAAAQAQLESMALSGTKLDDGTLKRLWPKVSIEVEKSPAAGQWQGLELIKVTADSHSFNKDVKIELSRYIQPKGNKPK
ncbi:MAG: hypothetical protein ACYTE8_08160, partial [Planctomycetota bacterium]|jgi:type II secretory pathway pseudopilin PulG